MNPRERALAAAAFYPMSHALLPYFPRLVWAQGPIDEGHSGDYFIDIDHPVAFACTPEDGALLAQIAATVNPRRMLEIGSYVGWSAAHLLYGAPLATMTIIDPAHGEIRWANLERAGVAGRTTQIALEWPGVLEEVNLPSYNLVFLDANHLGHHPHEDVRALRRVLDRDGVLILHDTWMPGVQHACAWLIEQGYTQYIYDVPSRLGVYWRSFLWDALLPSLQPTMRQIA